MQPLTRAHHFLTAQTGWRRRGVLVILGALGALALPPLFILPLALISYSGLFWMINGDSTSRRAFASGWWWGLGYFIASLYWICISLTVDLARFGWLIPFTLIGLNAIIALYPALACAIYHRFKLGNSAASVLLFCIIFSLTEYARGVLFTGFPWNTAGSIWAASTLTLQPAALFGIHGLTLLTLLLATSPTLWTHVKSARRTAMGIWAIWLLLMGWSALRIDVHLDPAAMDMPTSPYHLRIVQANISQHDKWKTPKETLQAHIRLSESPGIEHITHLIWPESAVPMPINAMDDLRGYLQSLAPENGALLTGSVAAFGTPENPTLHNSLYALTRNDVQRYDKHHLVPFGEYLPFRNWLPSIPKITEGTIDYEAGAGPVRMTVPNTPAFSPLICYEAIFANSVTDANQRPDWLLNVTNDAWFGQSSGPYQHLHMARMRSVEQGLPLVRAANTGVSAVIDSYGRIIRSLPLGEAGTLDAPLPFALPPTPYSRYGDQTYAALMGLCIVIVIIFIWTTRWRNV